MPPDWSQPCLTDSAATGVCLSLLRILLLGWTWSGLLRTATAGADDRPACHVTCLRLVLNGFLLNALLGLFLASAGMFTPVAQWCGVALLGLAGFGWGARRGLRPDSPRDLAGSGVFWGMLAGFILLVPAVETHWIAGGRDPGLYAGEAMRLAREGTFFPAPHEGGLRVPDTDLFLRSRFGFAEILPVVPFDPAAQSERPFFFPLTSVLMGQLALDGGLRAAACFAPFHAVLCLLALALAIGQWLGPRHLPVLGGLGIFLLLPVTAYHLTLPMTEFVELVCVVGAALCLASASGAAHASFAGFLLLGTANRFSFCFFGGLLLFLSLWSTRHSFSRAARGWRWCAGVTGIVLGVVLCQWVSRAGLLRLDDQARELGVMSAAILALGLALVPTAWLPERWHAGWMLPPGLLVLVASGAARENGPARMLFALEGAWAFIGPGVMVLGVLGIAGWLAARGRAYPAFTTLLVYLSLIGALILTRFEIAPDFPWASRRYLLGLAPALALGVGALASLLWSSGKAGRCLLAALVLPLALSTRSSALFPPSLGYTEFSGGLRREFSGLPGVLARVDTGIAPADVVICDHFVWGTPLRLIFGRQVIDGDWLRENNRMEEGVRWLLRQVPAGGRLLIFTSVPDGADWVEWAKVNATPLGEWPFTYPQVKSHRNQRKLEYESKSKVFRLYEVPNPGNVQ